MTQSRIINNNNKLITRRRTSKKKKTVKIISKPKTNIISGNTKNKYSLKHFPDINIINNNNNDDITIRFTSKRFYTKTKTARRVIREPLVKDKFAEFLDDNYNKLVKGNIIIDKDLNKWIFNDLDINCICKNLFKKELPEDCKCYDLEKYGNQGKSGALIYKLTCSQQPKILKIIPGDTYFVKMVNQTNKYIYLEMSRSIFQILVSNYVEKELPNNTLKTINSGLCKSNKKYIYQLMDEATYGTGTHFLKSILNKKYDDELNIIDEDYRYRIIISFLLQSVLIIGQLQSSLLEFFHGDYKPDNIFVKPYSRELYKYINFKVYGRDIKVHNMGFIAMVGDFDRSSITINSEILDKKYRIISPLILKPILRSYVNELIKKYGDIDPETYEGEIKLNKNILNYLIPKGLDPTASILRSAGVKLFRDLDLYTFFIKLINIEKMKEYIIDKKINHTIMSFMSSKFRNILLEMPIRKISYTETTSITFDILNKLNEPLTPIFSTEYIRSLNILNYKLFR